MKPFLSLVCLLIALIGPALAQTEAGEPTPAASPKLPFPIPVASPQPGSDPVPDAEPTPEATPLHMAERIREIVRDPVGDPFLIQPRLTLAYENSFKSGQADSQKLYFNPVWRLTEHSSFQINVPIGWYLPGTTGDAYAYGTGDMDLFYFNRFENTLHHAHGFGLRLTVDTGQIPNVGGGATVLAGGYAFEYLPNLENKLIQTIQYDTSTGTLAGVNPTRKLTSRTIGYHYFDDAFMGLELRQEWDNYAGGYSPFGIFSVGGAVTEGLQLWSNFRVPLNENARINNDNFRFSVGITLPF